MVNFSLSGASSRIFMVKPNHFQAQAVNRASGNLVQSLPCSKWATEHHSAAIGYLFTFEGLAKSPWLVGLFTDFVAPPAKKKGKIYSNPKLMIFIVYFSISVGVTMFFPCITMFLPCIFPAKVRVCTFGYRRNVSIWSSGNLALRQFPAGQLKHTWGPNLVMGSTPSYILLIYYICGIFMNIPYYTWDYMDY